MPTLAEIRAKLAADAAKKEGGSFTDNAVYPFWNIPEGKTAIVRFLPDGSPDADYFWQERMVIRLPFTGIKGQDESKETYVTIPCMKMWGENDYVLTQTKKWWDDPSLKDEARKYWIKRSYVFQGFVVDNPITEDAAKAPENPIRRFIINPTIFKIIKDAIMNPEMEELPTHIEKGCDFRINKTRQGQYADYSTSVWSRRERALSVAELEAIEKHKLFNLKDFLPQKPTEAQLVAIKEMFEASVNGEPYDGKRWGDAYRPAGYQADGSASKGASVPVSKPVIEDEDDVPSTASVPAAATNTTDALARLKARAAATSSTTEAAPSDAGAGQTDAQAILDLIKARSAAS